MKTIWKFNIVTTDRQTVSMPKGAEILCAQVQNGTVCLWAKVDTDAPSQLRGIETFGTGHPMVEDVGATRRYIGTYQLRNGALVFHVFEIIDDLSEEVR